MSKIKKFRKYVAYLRWARLKKWGNCWNFRHGFLPLSVACGNINKSNYKEFLSDKDYRMGHPYNGIFSPIIDNKLYLPMLLKDYLEYVPLYYFYKDKDGFLPLSGQGSRQRVGIDAFFSLLDEKENLVLKHTHDSVGRGFFLCQKKDGKYLLNGKEKDKASLAKLINGLNEYICTEYVYQHEYSSSIAAASVNTVRFICVWDYQTKSFFVSRTFHRFGCSGNVVDNVGSGDGILAFFDPETGVLGGRGVYNFAKKGISATTNLVHPDHNINLQGIAIPRYQEIKAKILEIANSISFLRYMGFDVVVTKDSSKILEINSRPGLDGAQQDKGLLTDPRTKRMFHR